MANPPSNVKFGTVTLGTVLIGKDGPDTGRTPDASTLSGQATFTPQLDPAYPYLINSAAGKLVFLDPVVCTVLNGELVDDSSVIGIELTSNVNLALNPQGWNWRLDLELTGRTIGPMYFDVQPDVVNDLSQIAVVPSGSRGIGVVRGESAYEIAVGEGFEGTAEEWLESLQGADGAGGVTNVVVSRTATTVTVKANDGGQTGDIPRATTSLAGNFAAADKIALNAAANSPLFTAANEAAQIALSATTKLNDWVKRTDTGLWYRRNNGTAGTLADFDPLPAGAVASVNGQTGTVTITKSSVGLGNVDNTADASKPISAATQTALNAKANTSAISAVGFSGNPADLIGPIPVGKIPVIATTERFSVASQAAMLALSAAGPGDIAVRSDTGDRFLLGQLPASTLENWIPFAGEEPPVDPIASIGGSRTLGTGAQQAAAGNDARLSDNRTPLNDSVTTPKILNLAVTNAKLDALSVSTGKLQDAAVTLPKTDVGGTPTTSKVIGYDGTKWSWVTAATGGATDLGIGTRTATTVPITSTTGSSATLPVATTSLAGAHSAADKTKIDTISTTAMTVLDDGSIADMRTTLNAAERHFVGTLAQITALTPANNIGRLAYATDMPGKPAYKVNVAATAWEQATVGVGQVGGFVLGQSRLSANVSLLTGFSAWADVGSNLPDITVTQQDNLYWLEVNGFIGAATNQNFSQVVPLKIWLRIVNSSVTKLAGSWAGRLTGTGSAGASHEIAIHIKKPIPAAFAASTWKLQARLSGVTTNVSTLDLVGGADMLTPTSGFDGQPLEFSATTSA